MCRPYPWEQDLWRLDRVRGHAQVLWTQPVTAAERQYTIDRDPEALEALFEQQAIDCGNVFRPSAA